MFAMAFKVSSQWTYFDLYLSSSPNFRVILLWVHVWRYAILLQKIDHEKLIVD